MKNPRRLFILTLTLCLAVLASHAMRAQQAGPASQPVGPTGTITGRVINAATGGPAAGLDVMFQNDRGRKVATATTDASGRYTSPPLPVGDYYVRTASLNPLGLVPQFFDKVTAGDRALLQSWDEMKQCTAVTVTANRAAAGVDLALQPGGTISGRVTDQTTGAPIQGVTVTAGLGAGTTDANGEYAIRGLPSDSFTVLTRVPRSPGHIDQLYDGVACWWGRCDFKLGKPVKVTAPETTPHIDFRLVRGAQISGTVTNAATGAPVAGVTVGFQPVSRGDSSATSTDAQGRYISTGLLPGPYYVHTDGPDEVGMFDQVYPGKPTERYQSDLQRGTPVSVPAGGAVTGKDFALSPGGVIQGKGTDAATGNPLSGFFVKVYTSDGVFAASSGPHYLSPGTYATPALPPGTYFVRTESFVTSPPPVVFPEGGAQPEGHVVDQAYGGVPCPEERCKPTIGTPVVVRGPGVVSGVDFALKRSPGAAPARPQGPSKELVIAPTSGPASGGVLVEIAGAGFAEGATNVRIGGRLAPSVECRWSLLKVVILPGTPGPADVVVTTARGPLSLLKGFTYTADQAAAPARRQ